MFDVEKMSALDLVRQGYCELCLPTDVIDPEGEYKIVEQKNGAFIRSAYFHMPNGGTSKGYCRDVTPVEAMEIKKSPCVIKGIVGSLAHYHTRLWGKPIPGIGDVENVVGVKSNDV